MRQPRLPLLILAAILPAIVPAWPVHAAPQLLPVEGPRTFVSATGSDAKCRPPCCTFASPCRTLQRAHDYTSAGGEIEVLDPAGYGQLTITKPISIQGHGFAEIFPGAGGTGITINAGAPDRINLSGLIVDGAGQGRTGILFNKGQSLTIEYCVVRGVTANGIEFDPDASDQLAIFDTLVADNGGFGVQIAPVGGAFSRPFFPRP